MIVISMATVIYEGTWYDQLPGAEFGWSIRRGTTSEEAGKELTLRMLRKRKTITHSHVMKINEINYIVC